MTNVLVDDTYLTDIADSIRSKLGVSDTYLPSEMAGAIDDIGGGVTPTGTKQISISANGTTTEDVAVYASAEITVAVPSASLGTKSITENGTYDAEDDSLDGYDSVTVNVSGGGTDTLEARLTGQLTSYENNNITTLYAQSFRDYTPLTSLKCHNVQTIGNAAIYGCTGLTHLAFPHLSGFTAIQNCSNLEVLDIGLSGGNFQTVSGDAKLATLIIRSSHVPALGNITYFNNTPFASGKTGGTLYVPQAMISSYQSANNWSTILGYATNNIQKIEGSIYETQYGDGTSI